MTVNMTSLTGTSGEDFASVLRSLGYRMERKPKPPEAAAPPLFCPKTLNLGNQLVNCFSFACDSQTYINNVPVVTCHCPIGESLAGTAVPPHTSFLTQAGQGDRAICADHPVSGPISLP